MYNYRHIYIYICTYIHALYVYLLFKFRIIHCLYPVIPVSNSFIVFNAKPTAVGLFHGVSWGSSHDAVGHQMQVGCYLSSERSLLNCPVKGCFCSLPLLKYTYLMKLESSYFRTLVSSPEAHWNFISPCSSHQPARNKTKQNRVVFSHVFTAARSTKKVVSLFMFIRHVLMVISVTNPASYMESPLHVS